MIRVDVWLPDPAGVLDAGAFGAGALIQIERSDDGALTYAEVNTFAIVDRTVQYQWWDSGGDATSWYRWRVSDSGDTIDSDYSAPFQGVSPAANVFPVSYVSLDRLLGMFETTPVKPARVARFAQLLGTATQQIIDEFDGRNYFRHPATGSETWVLDGDGGDTLHVHDGLVALDALELSFDGGRTYVPVAATDYVLRGDSPLTGERIPDGEPFFHVRFTGFGQYTNFTATIRAARLTGARGWATIPDTLAEATIQRARQLAFADGDYSGSAAGGPDEFGRPAGTDRFWPQSLYNFLTAENERFMACHVGSIGLPQYGLGGRR